MLLTAQHQRTFGSLVDLAGGAVRRRDVWPTRENAWETFMSRPSWQVWDERILKIYVVSKGHCHLASYNKQRQEHGLRSMPEPDSEGRTGVTLKCSKTQEAACYRDLLGRTRAYDYLSTLCKSPANQVHIVWGAIDDYMFAIT